MGKPASRRIMTRRNAQDGSSQAGKTADGSLNHAAAHDDVGDSRAVNFSPLDLFEEPAHAALITNLHRYSDKILQMRCHDYQKEAHFTRRREIFDGPAIDQFFFGATTDSRSAGKVRSGDWEPQAGIFRCRIERQSRQARSRLRMFRHAEIIFRETKVQCSPANPRAGLAFARSGRPPRNRCSARFRDEQECARACSPARSSRPRACGKASARVVPESAPLDARKPWWLLSFFSQQRAARNSFEDEVAMSVLAELSQNRRDGKAGCAQFAQDPGFVPNERMAVSSVPVCFAMPPSFFDYHSAHGQNGKVDCFVNASLSRAALSP